MKNRFYIETYGGLGDIVLMTPVFKKLKLEYPDTKVIVLCKLRDHLPILLHNPYIDSLRLLTPFNRSNYKLMQAAGLIKVRGMKYALLYPAISYNKRASEIIGEMIGVEVTEPDAQVYLTGEENSKARDFLSQFKNPVIIHITSVTTDNQMWPIENWNRLVNRMKDYTFIQLGKKEEAQVEGAVDMRGKTGIRHSMALVKYARSFVGVVSFLAHATNAFKTPGVVFFGPSSIAVWGHPNNINISKKLPCSGCVDWLRSAKCPYDKPCMRLITVDEVEMAIKKQAPVSQAFALIH